jgi:leucyl/phenylalanyl-tRNA--protein transferase
MAGSFNVLKRILRPAAYVLMRDLLPRINPAIVGSWTEPIVRRLGFSQAPTPTEIVVNYLRGFVLFGRDTPYGPWFHWHGPAARYVITYATATVPNRLRPVQRRGELEVRYDQDIEAIMHHCQEGRTGWLTPEVVNLYLEMQELGLIVSVGTYREGRLVGGFWGLDIGGVFGIMSMFHLESHAGTLALAALVEIVAHQGRWSVIDCGAGGPHWKRYGATELSRQQFSALVTKTLLRASLNGRTATLPKPDRGHEWDYPA